MGTVAPLVAFPALVGFWVFAGWRVRVEAGRVHLSPFVRLARAMQLLCVQLGAVLVPTVRAAAAAMVAWNEQIAAVERDLDRKLDLPDGLSVRYDVTPMPDDDGGS